MVPEGILKEIIERAKESWPDDVVMQKYCISEEKEAYEALEKLDFGNYGKLKQDFILSAKETFESWEEILSSVRSELSSYSDLQNLSVDGVDSSTLDAWKREAAQECEGYYEGQLDFVQGKISKHFSIFETRKAVDPIKKLLVEMEEIIGSECYNGNIQNYSSWGELESEGRDFRYPVKFYTGNDEKKMRKVPVDMSSEELITGYYAFGANELNIYRALYKVVQHLRKNYGLDV
ncbi:hypothetical protein BWR19_02850 [Halomonas sp. 1513]|nr:hypothetical protein [Halomonas sp. 1513]APX91970.1 hypothetical protein BWR19_02850 [Halomonas sp. 1513]